MVGYFIRFVLITLTLFSIELLSVVQEKVIQPWTDFLAYVSAHFLMVFDAKVAFSGNVILSTANGLGVEILPGCNGVEACIILIAAILSFPAPWKNRVYGIVLGCFAVQGLNVLRLISLYYLNQWDSAWFEFAHLYVWQALIMFDVLIVWLVWVGITLREKK